VSPWFIARASCLGGTIGKGKSHAKFFQAFYGVFRPGLPKSAAIGATLRATVLC
jgi:hypothetical protein